MERKPAIKCNISEIFEGKFLKGEKESFKPNLVLTKYGEKISRVNVFGIIVDKVISDNGNYGSITLNDFSGSIKAKAFGNESKKLENLEVGDSVVVIGKPKFWNDEIYINIEIVRKIEDPNFEAYRRLEILKRLFERKKMINEIISLKGKLSEEEFYSLVKEKYNFDKEEIDFILSIKEESKDFKSQILRVIKELDKGEGVDVLNVFETINLDSRILDSVLTELIKEGKIEEFEPGRLRVKE